MRTPSSVLLALALAGATAAAPSNPYAPPIEAYFEVKLLVRERVWSRWIQVDQWTGGRVSMHGTRGAHGSTEYSIAGIVDAPWTFRWYLAEDEVKLGAAVHVDRVEGDPYAALAPALEELARSKYALWWDADPMAPGPPWSEETGSFWARRHATELDEKDPLPDQSTYPFHVLGSLGERFGFTLRDGVVERVEERVTRPWLADGWTRALGGERVEGYGYWGGRRPRWEPRTYETFAAALDLLGPWNADPVAVLADVLATMQPRAARICRGWRGSGETPSVRRTAGRTVLTVDDGRVDGRRDLRYRMWRSTGDRSDELQILVDDRGDETFKFWVRVGYAPSPRNRLSGNPSTKALISSRTRR